ncbi:molybdopterin-dependent oxidoreductase [Amycolatopsis acidicola]|uniref:Molybdopterin-dependent oxidoreductase n=1 Tax=Amycolatopsis acidicola TaxID=2596893 RepID=A0A5N0V832_9PSEU|nr:molybdopterin-dependent oxidoreductase [Amycolatopsis acidicola]KAA9162559.1 molybdopterin-dependent oxidoreductase [Amycolatopsis acidicola]
MANSGGGTDRTVHTACRYCCGSCGMIASVGGDGRLTSLVADKEHPLTHGFSCARGLQSAEAMYHPGRILRPLKRTPGGFVEIGLEQALDEIAARLRGILAESGGESVGVFKGTQTWKNVTAHHTLLAWPAAIGSTRVFTTITIDQSAKQVTMRRMGYWNAGKHRLGDSGVHLIAGGNPFVSVAAGQLTYDPVKRLKAALKRGMKLIVIDPRRTETARQADLFLQVKPGEDPALLAGILRVVLDRGWNDGGFCDEYVGASRMAALRAAVEPFTLGRVAARTGVDAGLIERAARMFAAEATRGVAAAGTGPSMSPRSNLADHLVECLNVVCGRYLRAGERVSNPGVQNPWREFRAEVVPADREWERGPKTSTGHGSLFGELMSGVLADEILRTDEGRLRALFVNGGNPAVALPDQRKAVDALKALDLLVAVEPFMTPTAQLCDYILPPTLQFERPDTSASPHYEPLLEVPFAQYVPRVVDPPPGSEVVDDWYVYWSLARRLGITLTVAGVELDSANPPTTEQLLASILRDSQVPLEEIARYPGGRVFDVEPAVVLPRRPESAACFDVMPADIAAEVAEVAAEDQAGEERFPLRLVVRRLRGMMNSLGIVQPGVRRRHPYNAAYLNPADLAALGLADGAEIEIEADNGGRIPAIAEAEDGVRRGCVSMSHCWGGLPEDALPYREMGASTNVLVRTDAVVETINAMPRLSSIPVRIRARAKEEPLENGRTVS